MVSEKWLLHVVDRSISLKIQEIMHVNYCSGTYSSQFQGTDRLCVRTRVVQEEHEWADTASSDPLHLVVHAQQWGIWGNVVCSQDIRKVQKRFLTHMNYIARPWELARWDCWPPGRHLWEIAENGNLPEGSGRSMSSFPQKEERRWNWGFIHLSAC